jgi:hypothetical protein
MTIEQLAEDYKISYKEVNDFVNSFFYEPYKLGRLEILSAQWESNRIIGDDRYNKQLPETVLLKCNEEIIQIDFDKLVGLRDHLKRKEMIEKKSDELQAFEKSLDDDYDRTVDIWDEYRSRHRTLKYKDDNGN